MSPRISTLVAMGSHLSQPAIEQGARLPRVLLVDDDESMRVITRIVLQRSRRFVVVAEAHDGSDGIVKAGLCRPDLILLDLDMPGMGGLEALPGILLASPNSRVVVFSGADLDHSGACLKLGASAFIGKQEEWPSVVEKLLSIVPGR